MAPPSDADNNERERPSWREIDRRRDRSRHVGRGKSTRTEQSLCSTWAKKQYLKAVDRLFQGKRGSEACEELRKAVHRSYGTARFAAAVKKYLREYGLPEDWGTLMLLLDYGEDQVRVEAIESLKRLAPERKAVERQALKDKLEILTLTATGGRTVSLAEAALKEL
ncbi:MAG: hypothetical protein ACLFVT_06785 [Syntrophobacteria bacterium]